MHDSKILVYDDKITKQNKKSILLFTVDRLVLKFAIKLSILYVT